MYEMTKWCKNFVIVPKLIGILWLCLDLARLNQAFIGLNDRNPTLNDTLSKLINAYYMTLIDAKSDYHSLKFNQRSSYLTTFAASLEGTDLLD